MTPILSLHTDHRVAAAERAAPPLRANRLRIKTWQKVKLRRLHCCATTPCLVNTLWCHPAHTGSETAGCSLVTEWKSPIVIMQNFQRIAFPLNVTEKHCLYWRKYWHFSSCELSHCLLNCCLAKNVVKQECWNVPINFNSLQSSC